MVNWIVSSSLLILLVLFVRQVFKGRISLRMQYALWFLVVLRLLVPGHIGSSNISFANLAPSQSNIENTFIEPIIVEFTEQASVPELEIKGANDALSVVPSGSDKQINIADILEFIWIGGAFVTAMCIIISNLSFYGKLRRSRRTLKVNSKLPVYSCKWLETPCLFGVFKPAIYMSRIDDEKELHHVLCHESMHYRQGDHIWSLLRSVCLVLHWYNPLVWAAAVLSRRDGELACDEAVIKALGENERTEYGKTLLHMTIRGRETIFNIATSMKSSKKGIAERIRFIAKQPYMRFYTFLTVLITAIVIVGCSFVGAETEELNPASELTESPEPSPDPSPVVTAEPEPLRYKESFLSNDGSVEFFLDFEVPELAGKMPVMEIEKRDVTVEDAQAVAKAVFGTTELYERKTHRYAGFEHELLTREAAEEYLAFARTVQEDEELLRTIYGEKFFAMGQEDVSHILDRYGRLEYLSQLPTDADRALMNWEFVLDRSNPDVAAMEMNGSFEQNDLRYRFSAVNYDELSGNHSVYVMVDRECLAQMAHDKAYLEHGSETEPTREQFAAAQSEAVRILEEMEPGKWRLASCEGYQYPNGRYIINISAFPVYEGFMPVRQDSIYSFERKEMVLFQFGADGAFLYMRYMFPMVQSEVSADASCINFDAAMAEACNYFKDGSVERYDYWFTDSEGLHHEGETSKVYISDIQQGWMHEPVDGEDDKFTLQPVISLLGYFESFDENGEETEWSKTRANTPFVLLNISALDGSVLQYKAETYAENGLPRN